MTTIRTMLASWMDETTGPIVVHSNSSGVIPKSTSTISGTNDASIYATTDRSVTCTFTATSSSSCTITISSLLCSFPKPFYCALDHRGATKPTTYTIKYKGCTIITSSLTFGLLVIDENNNVTMWGTNPKSVVNVLRAPKVL